MKKIRKKVSTVLVVITVLLGGIYFMNKQSQRAKEDKLYRHAFSLLEEQIATYIVEHYAGVSKVEFSPIYVVETDMYNMGSIKIVPVIYDEYGDRAFIGGNIPNQNIYFDRFGLGAGLSSVDFTIEGKHFIYLGTSKSGDEIDVSGVTSLPDEAKVSVWEDIDEPIEFLLLDGQIKDIRKEEGGSPNAEVIYNLNIIRGEVKKPW